MSLRLALSRMRGANYDKLRAFIREDAALAGKPKLLILADILYCTLRYGAAFHDYHTLRFYKLSARERDTFITMGVNVKVVKQCNDINKRPIFEAKTLFNKTFDKYLKRRWVNVHETERDSFVTWLDDQPVVFAKRDFSSSGKDVVRFETKDFPDAGAFYDKLVAERFDLVEEAIHQHPFMSGIYPGSVNTMRLVTMLKDGESHLIFGILRVAIEGFVDNLNAGGCCCVIDCQEGVISSDAMTLDMRYLETHPVTGFRFKGSRFPMWEESVAMVNEAAKVCPDVRYTAWDVALTPDGPVFVEGNYHPGYGLLQLPDQIGKKADLFRYL